MAKNTQKLNKKPSRMKKLGNYLKELRNDLGLSIHEVARRTQISPAYISKLEGGNSFKSVTVDTLVKLSETYDIPIVAILEEVGFLVKGKGSLLPELGTYLKMKYNLSAQAIRDMEMAKEIVDKKYGRKIRS